MLLRTGSIPERLVNGIQEEVLSSSQCPIFREACPLVQAGLCWAKNRSINPNEELMFHFKSVLPLMRSLLIVGVALPAALALPPQGIEKKIPFANPHLLISTEWLAEHGRDAGVTVVDVRKAADFEAGHVPGAINIATAATYAPKARGSIGTPKQIAALLGSKGIGARTHVVLYDGGRSTSAARVFWTLEVYGHARVSVLDGGVAKWKHEKRELTSELSAVSKVEYEIGARPQRCSTIDSMMDDLEDPDVIMLDARSKREFDGGRIPQSVRIEWMQNYTAGDVPVFKTPAELFKLYADQGVTADKRVHAY